jgi:hypothetical protein
MVKCRHGVIGAGMRLMFSERIIGLHAHYTHVCKTAEVVILELSKTLLARCTPFFKRE